MIYACILSGLAGYIVRAVIGVWKEDSRWYQGYKAGREQGRADASEQFEDLCVHAIVNRNAALRDKQEASEW